MTRQEKKLVKARNKLIKEYNDICKKRRKLCAFMNNEKADDNVLLFNSLNPDKDDAYLKAIERQKAGLTQCKHFLEIQMELLGIKFDMIED